VQGLRVGSNVLFRGVRVGYVTDIDVITDESMLNYQIPVTFEILPESVTLISGGKAFGSPTTTSSRLDDMIRAGLRTRLDVESFVTGQLVVDMDMHPDTKASFAPEPALTRDSQHPERHPAGDAAIEAFSNAAKGALTRWWRTCWRHPASTVGQLPDPAAPCRHQQAVNAREPRTGLNGAMTEPSATRACAPIITGPAPDPAPRRRCPMEQLGAR
jgi:hypothetical protein